MEVIRKGVGWSKKVKCTGYGNGGGGCGAVLRIEEGDIYETTNYERDGGREFCRTIECPQCGKETDIDFYSVPSQVKVFKDRAAYQKAKKNKG